MDIDIEYLASDNWDESMPERLRWLRNNDPIHWSEKDNLWIVTKFEDVSAISKNQGLFTSGEGVRPDNPGKLGLIDEPEPRHTQLRSLINKGFTPRMVKKLEESFRVIVKDTLDKVAKKGECDFVNDIAVPLPLLLIAVMMGIRPEDYDRFHDWSDRMIAADGNTDHPEIMQDASMAFIEYSAYVGEILEDRRKNPQDDLLSILVGAKEDGVLRNLGVTELSVKLDDEHMDLANDELIMLSVILMVAGNETTRNGISGGMQFLIENSDERQKLIDNPDLIPAAVEEVLRFVSPVHSFSRTVTADTMLHDKEIKKGQKVLMIYPSANRDEDIFDDPDHFDVERNPQHLAFGIGNHFCLGANLARMEMRVAFAEILRRFPDMQYAADGPVIKPSALVRSCMEMKVRFTPES